jgi:hypothetical protein
MRQLASAPQRGIGDAAKQHPLSRRDTPIVARHEVPGRRGFQPRNRSITPPPLKGRRPSGRARLEGNCRWFPERQNDKPCLERGINGTCPRPHRKDALAQCRIGFQPVSPNHGTNGRTIENPIFRHKYCRQFINQRGRPCPGKGSSCGPRRQAGSLSYIAFRSVER